MRKPILLGIYADPNRIKFVGNLLPLIPWILMIFAWIYISNTVGGNYFPTFSEMGTAMYQKAFVANKYSGEYVLWRDYTTTMGRLLLAVINSAVFGLFLGLYLGSLPGIRKMFLPIVVLLSIVVLPMFQLVILKVVGYNDLGRQFLVFLGTTFIITRGVFLYVSNIKIETTVKASTLGLSGFGIIHRLYVPMVMESWRNSIRLSLGAAWIFLIMTELQFANAGMGYQVDKNMKEPNMDVIIPYGIIVCLTAFFMDFILSKSWIEWKTFLKISNLQED